MTPQELKNSILQLAIQGKLVEQRPEEGTAAELYKQIQAEKQELIKAGKIKKEKPLPEITEDEIPFEIPESWMWCRVEDILLSIGAGKSLRCNEIVPDDNKPGIIKVSAVTWGSFQENESKTCLSNSDWNEDYSIRSGDFLISRANTKKLVGACVIVDKIRKKLMLSDKILRITFSERIDLRFILNIMRSSTLRSQIEAVATGTSDSMKNISQKDIRGFLIPLPPLAEQKRIVAKIEELLPLIESYEKAWSRLENFNKQFPVDMKKSILQLAIQGKLVEQRSEEGTSEELYKQIQAEKQALIKAGKIKRDKRTESEESPSENEIPFDIPETWKWTYLGCILNKLTDGTHKTPKYASSGVKFVSVKDMSSGNLSLENTKYISVAEHEELYTRCDPVRGDMLLSKVGTTGVPAIVNTDEPFSLFVSVALLKYSHSCIDEHFLYYLLLSPLVQMQATENTRGVGNKNWVLDAIAKTVIVLPPLAEQKRIVAKLEELLPLCERLK